jgi:Family of unknown function (DUF6444)
MPFLPTASSGASWHDFVDTWEARLSQHSPTSHRPPSSDSPSKKPRQRPPAVTRRQAGGKPGHPGHRQARLPATVVHEVRPERWAGGNTTFPVTTPSHPPQVLELPPITMEGTHGAEALSGDRQPQGQPLGGSGSCSSAKRVVSGRGRPTPWWWMLSLVVFGRSIHTNGGMVS